MIKSTQQLKCELNSNIKKFIITNPFERIYEYLIFFIPFISKSLLLFDFILIKELVNNKYKFYFLKGGEDFKKAYNNNELDLSFLKYKKRID